MARVGRLTIAHSQPVVKFLIQGFVFVGQGADRYLSHDFWTATDAQILARAQGQNLEAIPGMVGITKSVESWKRILKCIKTKLSGGNLETPITNWVNTVIQGNKQAEMDALRLLTEAESVMDAIKISVEFLAGATEFAQDKLGIGVNLVAAFDEYESARRLIEDAQVDILRKVKTQQVCIKEANKTIDLNQDLVKAMGIFLSMEPSQPNVRYVHMLFGPVNNGLQLNEIIQEIRNGNYSCCIRIHTPSINRRSFPEINDFYNQDIATFQEIKRTRDEEAEENVKLETIKNVLREDLVNIFEEVYKTQEDEFTLPFAEEMRDQTTGAIKRLQELRNMDPNVFAGGIDFRLDGGLSNVQATFGLSQMKQRIYNAIDKIKDAKRDLQDKQKTQREELCRQLPREKLPPLNSARGFLNWSDVYSNLKTRLKAAGLPGWEVKLCQAVRDSLRLPDDIRGVENLKGLREYEQYFKEKYVVNTSIIHDILEDVLILKTPTTNKESIRNMEEIRKCLRLIKRREMEDKLNETLLDRLIEVAFLKDDKRDFYNDYSKHVLRARMSGASSTRIGSDSDESDGSSDDQEVDLEQSIRQEIQVGSLKKKKNYFKKFMAIKMQALRDREASLRTNWATPVLPKPPPTKNFFKKNGKVFSVVEVDKGELEEGNDPIEEHLFVAREGLQKKKVWTKRQDQQKVQVEKVQKKCPLDCGKEHIKGSVFFCDKFRAKSLEEKKKLVQKRFLCPTCLRQVKHSTTFPCKYPQCRRCGKGHNFLLCDQIEEGAQKLFLAKDEEFDDDEPDQETKDLFFEENVYYSTANSDSKGGTDDKGHDNEANDSDEANLTDGELFEKVDQEEKVFSLRSIASIKAGLLIDSKVTTNKANSVTPIDETKDIDRNQVGEECSESSEEITNTTAIRKVLEDYADISKNDDGDSVVKKKGRKSPLSVVKWRESGKWSDIINEGDEYFKTMLVTEKVLHANQRYETHDDSKFCLTIPPEPPPVVQVESPTKEETEMIKIGPKSDMKLLYQGLLHSSVELFKSVEQEGKNMTSCVLPITVIGDKSKVDMNKLKDLELSYEFQDDEVFIETPGCLDSGADPTIQTAEISDVLNSERLEDDGTTIRGATGVTEANVRHKVSFMTTSKDRENMECRTVEKLGGEDRPTAGYMKGVMTEFGMSKEQATKFNLDHQDMKIHFLIGLKNGKCLGQKMNPLTLGLRYPVLSPNLVIWKTILSNKMLITGQLGTNPDLVDDSFPIFNIPKNMFTECIDKFASINVTNKNQKCFVINDELNDDPVKIKKAPVENVFLIKNLSLYNSEESCGIHSTELQFPIWGGSDTYKDCNSLILENESRDPEIVSEVKYLEGDELKAFLTQDDGLKLERFLASESKTYLELKRKCTKHNSRCIECEILNKRTSAVEDQLIQETWKNMTAEKDLNGRFRLTQRYVYRHDPHKTFHPSNSNLIQAMKNSKGIIKKVERKGAIHLNSLVDQVEKAIKIETLVDLKEDEVNMLKSKTHSFTFFNIVENPVSRSTPIRLINNTSNNTPNEATTVSIEQMSPTKCLNNMEGALIRFELHPFTLVGDIKSAYRQIGVDDLTAMLRLFYWWWDVPTCLKPRILKRKTQDFGDTSAAWGLETACLKYIVPACKLSVTRYIVEAIRFADNVVFSFSTISEFWKVKADLEEAFSKYNLNLKYCISNKTAMPDVLNDPGRGNERYEPMLGLYYDVVNDTIEARPRYNIHGTSRGVALGPGLQETELKPKDITRLTWMRLTAQTFDRLGNLLGPIVMSMKILASRACEMVNVQQMNVPLISIDTEFVKISLEFLENLKKIGSVKPFPRAWIPVDHNLKGFIISRDGGAPGFGILGHCLSQHKEDEEGTRLMRRVCLAKSKVCKRNVFCHEMLSTVLAMEQMKMLMECLLFDYSEKDLQMISLGDASCVSCLFNPALSIKNMLIKNCVEKVKSIILELNLLFPKAVFTLGYIAGNSNPADTMSKLFIDPISVLNSDLYRIGPQEFNSVKGILKYPFLTCKDQKLIYKPLPNFLLGISDSNANIDNCDENFEQKCLTCREDSFSCGVMMTRSQAKEMEMSEVSIEKIIPTATAKMRLKRTFQELEFQLDSKISLMDINYNPISNLILEKEKYLKIRNHNYRIKHLIRTFAWIAFADICKKTKYGNVMEFKNIELCKEGYYMLLRCSQLHFPPPEIKRIKTITIHEIKTVALRLDVITAVNLLGGKFCPLLSSKDELKWKFVRYQHELQSNADDLLKVIHHSSSSTEANLKSGSIGVYWKGMRKDISDYIWSCATCMNYKELFYTPTHGSCKTKINAFAKLFSEISIDPLGGITCKFFASSRSIKIMFPLLCVDLQHGLCHLELMGGNKTGDILNALTKIQARFSVKIRKVYSDAGTNLLKDNLEIEKSTLEKQRIHDLLTVKNNLVDSQFRNYSESYTKMVKRYIAQAFDRKRSAALPVLDVFETQTIFELVCQAVNSIPYTNTGLKDDITAPIHLLQPASNLEEIEIPDNGSKLKNVRDTIYRLQIYLKRFLELRNKQIMLNSERYASTRRSNSKVKKDINCSVGDLVFIHNPSKHDDWKYGIVEAITGKDALIRLSNRESLNYPIQMLHPLVSSQFALEQRSGEMSRIRPDMFISVPINSSHCTNKLVELQNGVIRTQVDGDVWEDYRVDQNMFHITIAVISTHEKSMEKLMTGLERVVKVFGDTIGRLGFPVQLRGLAHFDSNVFYTKIVVGENHLKLLRHLCNDSLDEFITDQRFLAHVTLFQLPRGDDPMRKQLEGFQAEELVKRFHDYDAGTFAARSMEVLRMKRNGNGVHEIVSDYQL